MPTYQWVSPTGHIEPSGDWQNPANAYDGNWDNWTSDDGFYGSPPYTNFLTLTLAALMYIDKIRLKYMSDWAYKKIDVDVYNQESGAWIDLIDEILTYGVQKTIVIPTVYTDRVRIRVEGACTASLFELDVERVIPDQPAPPPPPTIEEPVKDPPNPPEVYQTEKQKTQGQPPHGTARIRTLHHKTRIAPWVV